MEFTRGFFVHLIEHSRFLEATTLNRFFDSLPDLFFKNMNLEQDELGNEYQKFLKDNKTQRQSKRNHEGIYYTPKYIVDFIIDHTLGVILHDNITKMKEAILKNDEKSLNKVIMEFTNIKILDPSCGSGALLVRSLHVMYKSYIEIKNELMNFSMYKNQFLLLLPDNNLELLKLIILRHLYGIDFDKTALDITKVNLLLNVISLLSNQIDDGDNLIEDISGFFFSMTLNFRWGNSLFGLNLSQNLGLIKENEVELIQMFQIRNSIIVNPKNFALIERYNQILDNLRSKFNNRFMEHLKKSNIPIDNLQILTVFHWVLDFFHCYFLENGNIIPTSDSGFDIIIGNPPWGSNICVSNEHIKELYNYKGNNINSFELFMLKSLDNIKSKGLHSFIIPRNFIKTNDYKNLRQRIIKTHSIKLLANCGACFERVSQETIIYVISGGFNSNNTIELLPFLHPPTNNTNKINRINFNQIHQNYFDKAPDFIFNITYDKELDEIIEKMESHPNVITLSELVDHSRGIEYGQNGELIKCNCGNFTSLPKKKNTSKKCNLCGEILNKKVADYHLITVDQDKNHNKKIYVGNHVGRYTMQPPKYLDLNVPGVSYKNSDCFRKEKILIMKISDSLKASLEREGAYTTQALYMLSQKSETKLEHILGILNSKLMAFYYEIRINLGAKLTTNVTLENILRLPICKHTNKILVNLVNEIILFANIDRNVEKYSELDEKIDALVFKLYGLNRDDVSRILTFLDIETKYIGRILHWFEHLKL